MIMKLLKTFVFLGLLLISQWAHSDYPKTEADFMLLPPYCKARKEGRGPNYDLWQKRFGPNFLHMHHYCSGLHSINLARKTFDHKLKSHILETAIKEMETVQHEFSPDFMMQTKIYYDLGNIYEIQERNNDAMLAYQQSIRLNPKLAFSYSALSDLYKKQNKIAEAIEILKQGLKYKPDSKSLKKHLEKLTKGK